MRKILYIFDREDIKSRLPLAQGARDKGYNVTIGLIGGDDEELDDFKTVPIKKPSGGLGPLSLLTMMFAIRKLIKAENPDLLHTVTLKYAFICGLASLFLAPRKIYTLAGLGYLFRSGDDKSLILRFFISPLLRHILCGPRAFLIFQNPDDQFLMIQKGYAKEENTFLVRGSGVDLEEFSPGPNPQNEPPVVLMPTRLVKEKGIDIFIEAAGILAAQGVQAKFQIAGGGTVHNPKAISDDEMGLMLEGSAVEWLGRVEDMPGLLNKADLIVYPSHYGEGIPRVLLESAACGKAIITTDHPGCREAVKHNENGILVPIKDAKTTTAAIELLLIDKEKRYAMGKKSRALAEIKFDINLIVEKTLEVYAATE